MPRVETAAMAASASGALGPIAKASLTDGEYPCCTALAVAFIYDAVVESTSGANSRFG